MQVHYRSRLAQWFLPRQFVAFTFGSRVFARTASLTDSTLRHEQVHVDQWQRYGFVGFLSRYVWYHLRYGYHDNPLEIEARAAE